MKKKHMVLASVLVCSVSAVTFFAFQGSPPQVEAVAEVGTIVLYTGENFTGREITITGGLADLPKEIDPDQSEFSWNDRVKSLIVVSGTWRLYQHGRLNTRLDGAALEDFNLALARPARGWSALVSPTSQGQLEVADVFEAGLDSDISSLELISSNNLPDWAMTLRR